MKTWVRKTLSVGVLAAGALLLAPTAAQADVRQSTGDNNGILNGTQLVAPVSVPVNIVGNAVGILGEANATGAGVNWTEGGRHRQSTGNNNGILNGTQAYLPVSVPLNVVGNSVAVLGSASATGVGVNGRKVESKHTTEHGWGGQSTGNNNGILNGTQIYAPIDVPINVCGNSLAALLGQANAQAVCSNGHGHRKGHRTEGAKQSTGNNNGILNGTQLYAPISLPVNLAGNSVAVLGSANSRGVAVNESGHGDGFGQSTGDNNGILNGTQIAAPISVPINICGNALGILGSANATAVCSNGGSVKGTKGDGNGGQNGGDNGADDDDYMGDGDQAGDDDGYGDDTGAQAGDDDAYGAGNGDGAYDADGGRSTEASPVADLTQTVGGVGSNAGLGSLGLLNTLR